MAAQMLVVLIILASLSLSSALPLSTTLDISHTEMTSEHLSTNRGQFITTTPPGRKLTEVTTPVSTEGSSGTCLLSSEQVQDIQSPRTGLFYMAVNKQVIAHQSLLELYVQLHRIVTESAASQNTVTDIWLSRAPCKLCQEILEFIFAGASTKPTIHIESWQTSHNQTTTYRGFLQSMGCISKLKSQDYPIVAWDWKEFQEKVDSTCNFDIDILNDDEEYFGDKDALKRSLPLITNFDDFCQ